MQSCSVKQAITNMIIAPLWDCIRSDGMQSPVSTLKEGSSSHCSFVSKIGVIQFNLLVSQNLFIYVIAKSNF